MSGTTVWILGAGFSYGVGGPLFRELFRGDHRIQRALVASKVTDGEPVLTMLHIYRKHAPEDMGGSSSVNGLLWHDPEEFLDFIENAGPGNSTLEDFRLIDTRKYPPDRIKKACRWALAVECSSFLDHVDLKMEKWAPYLNWVGHLSQHDTVITFNYDSTPEHLAHEGSHLHVVLPKSASLPATCTRIFKLHGSVDWMTSASGEFERNERLPTTIPPIFDGIESHDLLIGVPGPGKHTLAAGLLKPLWDSAVQAIGDAESIRFIGYRFPPTDAHARTMILSAVRTANAKNLQTVEIVLGPDLGSMDALRVTKLLEHVLGPSDANKVKTLPLFAQDHFSLLDLV